MADPTPSLTPRADFADRLLAWWEVHGRKNLPWQRARTPYRVWVSEIMLQQTQARVAAPYFEAFMERFPGIGELAAAHLDDVLHLWSGLGYYARARNLHRAARRIARDHGGTFPRRREAIQALPGIGRSTAAAIVAQAFGEPAAILDANVKRVLARQHRVPGAPASAATAKRLWHLAQTHTPARRAADYTQAIMDLGALVCRRSSPDCAACPVADSCRARAAGDAQRFPERAARRPRRLERRRFFVVTAADGTCLVERRPPRGIWGGLWSPPERPAEESARAFLALLGVPRATRAQVRLAPPWRHGFTHFDLELIPVHIRLDPKPPLDPEHGAWAWIDPRNHRLGLSAAAAKLLAATAEPET